MGNGGVAFALRKAEVVSWRELECVCVEARLGEKGTSARTLLDSTDGGESQQDTGR